MLFRYSIIVVMLTTLSPPALSEPQVFAPIVVEELELESQNSNIKIEPYTGASAKSHTVPTNQFGVEITNIENELDISNLRRNKQLHFNDKYDLLKKASLLKAEWGKTQSVLIKSKYRFELIAGALRDYQDYNFQDNNNTPFSDHDDFENSYQIKEEHYFIGLQKDQFLAEFDQRKNDVIAATQPVGNSQTYRLEGNIQFQFRNLSNTLFVSHQQNKFESYDPNRFDNKTKINRLVLHGDFKLPYNLSATYDIGHELWKRSFDTLPGSEFFRNYFKAKLLHQWTSSRWIETKTIAGGQIIDDKDEQKALVDLKGEISSSTQYPAGVSISSNYYQRYPTPSQLFGDGALLMENRNLEIETGVRTQFGPWIKSNALEAEVQVFVEQSKNSPLQVGISPSSAKTLSVGGIWTRGFLVKNRLKWKNTTLHIQYQFQEALNDSNINWEKGNPIPERPKHYISTGIELQFKRFHFGSNFIIEKGKYRDLAGMDLAPTSYSSSSFLAYTHNRYRVNLQFNNLFLSSSLRNINSFQDRAGTNILEPMRKEPEVKLSLEYLI